MGKVGIKIAHHGGFSDPNNPYIGHLLAGTTLGGYAGYEGYKGIKKLLSKKKVAKKVLKTIITKKAFVGKEPTYEDKLLESFLQGFTKEFHSRLEKDAGSREVIKIIRRGARYVGERLKVLTPVRRAAAKKRISLREQNISKVVGKDEAKDIIKVRGRAVVDIPEYGIDQGTSATKRNVIKRQKRGDLPEDRFIREKR